MMPEFTSYLCNPFKGVKKIYTDFKTEYEELKVAVDNFFFDFLK